MPGREDCKYPIVRVDMRSDLCGYGEFAGIPLDKVCVRSNKPEAPGSGS